MSGFERNILYLVALLVGKKLGLFSVFNALCDAFHAKRVSQLQNGAHKVRVFFICRDTVNEPLVDLDDFCFETLQIRGIRIAGSEVVDRERDACFF